VFFRGDRNDVPSSLYGALPDLLERTGWTYQEYLEQPDDLVTEMMVRAERRALIQREREQSREQVHERR
jgi:hypothetical protein